MVNRRDLPVASKLNFKPNEVPTKTTGLFSHRYHPLNTVDFTAKERVDDIQATQLVWQSPKLTIDRSDP